MKKLIIVGNGICALMMKHYIESTEFGDVEAFVVDREFINELYIEGIPVIALDELEIKYPAENVLLITGVGYRRMGGIREEMFQKCKLMGYTFDNYVHPTAVIAKDMVIGEGNVFLEGVICETGCSIGNANFFYGGAIVGHDTVIGDYSTFSLRSTISGCCKVNNNCFVGNSGIVRDKVILGKRTLIGEGACAFKNMDEYSVIKAPQSSIMIGKSSEEYM